MAKELLIYTKLNINAYCDCLS